MNGSLLIGWIIFITCLLTGVRSQCDIDSVYDIQLSNDGIFTSIPQIGRVEICVCSNITDSSTCAWQTVSTGSTVNAISWKNSIVVCRELGYKDVQSPILQNTVQAANLAPTTVQIYSTTFNCDGTESTLKDCATGSSTSGLTHAADAYVHCQSSVTNRKIRLTGSTLDDRGIAEYYLDGEWRTICIDSWENAEASLFCRSLGFNSGTATTYSISGHRGTNIGTAQYISSFTCSSTAYYFSSCTTQRFVCFDFNSVAGVFCSSDNSVQEGSVRQFYTGSSSQRVEVFYDGRWGTVCRSNWDIDDGEVACRELNGNVDEVSISLSTSFNSMSSRPIWIFDYSCDGDEDTLSDCDQSGYPVGYYQSAGCSHSSEAGIDCPTNSGNSGGGLSGGAIAGIVIGVVVTMIIVFSVVGGNDKARKRRAAAAAAARNRANNVVLVQQTPAPTNVITPVTQTTTVNAEPRPDDTPAPADPTLTQAPPPAYSEALKHMDVVEPPQYPNEEKKVPYPVSSNNDPAYPSAPGNDYQGYPPPTQPSGFGTNPPPSVNPYPPPPSSNPYPPPPPSANPYPPSVNPYPPGNPYPPSANPYPEGSTPYPT